jgi:hypothetical protein
VQQDVARDLEHRVADEEQPGAEGVRRRADPEVDLELLLGEGDVAAVEEGDHVHQQQERDQPSEDLPGGRLAQVVAPPGGLGNRDVGHRCLLAVVDFGSTARFVLSDDLPRQCMCLPPSTWMVAPLM